MSSQTKIKLIHLFLWTLLAWTLFANFNMTLLLIGAGLGWMLWLAGVSVSLHKWYTHGAFQPKTRWLETVLLYLGTICCIESHISWGVGHKLHHKYSGQEYDPFTGMTTWQKIKVGMYFHKLPTDKEIAKFSLKKSRNVVWFHRHYFSILAVTFLLVFAAAGNNVGYFTALPVLYVLLGYAWITTLAHSLLWERIGWAKHDTGDHSSDSHFWSIVFPGEGYHNTHHKFPGLWNNASLNGGFDISAQLIKFIGVVR